MVITYKNYPALKILDGDYSDMFYPEDKYMIMDRAFIRDLTDNLSSIKDVIYVSEPFFEAVAFAKEKLATVLFNSDDMTANIDLNINTVTILKYNMIFEKFSIKKGEDKVQFFQAIFNKDGKLLCVNNYDTTWGSKAFFTNDQETSIYITHNSLYVIYIELFKQFAEVETVLLPPNKKVVTDKEKRINKTNVKMTYLDSKWFKTLVQSEGFSVRGHFRFQPYKNENKEVYHKLIWIDEFQKKGYTSKAKIEKK